MNPEHAFRLAARPTVVDNYTKYEHCEVGIAAMHAKEEKEEINMVRVPTGLNMPALVVPCMLLFYRPLEKPLDYLGEIRNGMWTTAVFMMSLITRSKLASQFHYYGGLCLTKGKNGPGALRVFEQRNARLGALYGDKKIDKSPGMFKRVMGLLKNATNLGPDAVKYEGPSVTTTEKLMHRTPQGNDNGLLISQLKSDGYIANPRLVTAVGMLEGHTMTYPKSMLHPHVETHRKQIKQFVEEPGGPMPPMYRQVNKNARDAFRRSLWFALMLLGLSAVAGANTSIQEWHAARTHRIYTYPASQWNGEIVGAQVPTNPLCLNYGIIFSTEDAERIKKHNERLGCGEGYLFTQHRRYADLVIEGAETLPDDSDDESDDGATKVDPNEILCWDKERIERHFLALSDSSNPDYIYGHASLWRATFEKTCAIEKYGYVAMLTHSHHFRLLVEALGVEKVYYDNINEGMVKAWSWVLSTTQSTIDYVVNGVIGAFNRVINAITGHRLWGNKVKAIFDVVCFIFNHCIILAQEAFVYAPLGFITRCIWKFCCTPTVAMFYRESKNWTLAAWRGQLLPYAHVILMQTDRKSVV